MRYHKIRNVPMEVCTAEQKIAYELAFRAHISFQDIYDKARAASAVCVSDILYQIKTVEMKNYSYIGKGKFDIDAIAAALNAGIEQYMNGPFIASDYEMIGKAFPAHYMNT